jgi:Ca2+-binding RTX toxin-like protein
MRPTASCRRAARPRPSHQPQPGSDPLPTRWWRTLRTLRIGVHATGVPSTPRPVPSRRRIVGRALLVTVLMLAVLTPAAGAAPTFVRGGEDSDALLGLHVDVWILARGGDDTAAATGGGISGIGTLARQRFSDELQGGSGDDLLVGDVLCASSGEIDPHRCTFDDTTTDLDGDKDVDATDGDADRLVGGSGDDELHGGQGIDWLDGGTGADILVGGTEAWAPLTPPERLEGGDGSDLLLSNARPRRASGFTGLPAEPGDLDAVLNGGGGADVLVGAFSSQDRMRGGDGTDELDASDGIQSPSASPCRVHTQDGAGCWDRLYGGLGDDFLTGSPANDLLVGGDDDDEIDAGQGHDSVFGGDGDDVVEGGPGQDRLSGGTGDDVLVGTETPGLSNSLQADSGLSMQDTFVSCGSGHDTVYRQSIDGQAPANCERVVTL